MATSRACGVALHPLIDAMIDVSNDPSAGFEVERVEALVHPDVIRITA